VEKRILYRVEGGDYFVEKSMGIVILAVGLMALLLGANANAEKLETVRLSEVVRSVFYTPQYVAIANGSLKKKVKSRLKYRLGAVYLPRLTEVWKHIKQDNPETPQFFPRDFAPPFVYS